MKILAISDEENERVYQLIGKPPFDGIELILGCGDLPYSYLEYLVTLTNVPLAYVPGNHDPAYRPSDPQTFAEGCLHLDGKVEQINGLILVGLGGSIRYRNGVNQYTQFEMFIRVWRLTPRLLLNRIFAHRWADILVTHAPPFGINWLLRLTQPRYHLHGHFHFTQRNLSPSITQYGPTQVINVFPYRLLFAP